MSSITIIGSGAMGSAIAGLARRGNHTVEVLGREQARQEPKGDVVVLALPYPAIEGVLDGRAEQFEGKIVVDISNPLDFETFDSLTVAPDSSAAAEVAEMLPGARVLKAFNTNFAGTLTSGKVGDADTTVLIAGDDTEAKAQVAGIVSDAGLRSVDAGSMRRARELEAVGFLQLTLAAKEAIGWTGGFSLQP